MQVLLYTVLELVILFKIIPLHLIYKHVHSGDNEVADYIEKGTFKEDSAEINEASEKGEKGAFFEKLFQNSVENPWDDNLTNINATNKMMNMTPEASHEKENSAESVKTDHGTIHNQPVEDNFKPLLPINLAPASNEEENKISRNKDLGAEKATALHNSNSSSSIVNISSMTQNSSNNSIDQIEVEKRNPDKSDITSINKDAGLKPPVFVNITPLVNQEDSISHHQDEVETTTLQNPFNKNNISTQGMFFMGDDYVPILKQLQMKEMEKKEQEQERIKSEIERLKKELLQKETNAANNTEKETNLVISVDKDIGPQNNSSNNTKTPELEGNSVGGKDVVDQNMEQGNFDEELGVNNGNEGHSDLHQNLGKSLDKEKDTNIEEQNLGQSVGEESNSNKEQNQGESFDEKNKNIEAQNPGMNSNKKDTNILEHNLGESIDDVITNMEEQNLGKTTDSNEEQNPGKSMDKATTNLEEHSLGKSTDEENTNIEEQNQRNSTDKEDINVEEQNPAKITEEHSLGKGIDQENTSIKEQKLGKISDKKDTNLEELNLEKSNGEEDTNMKEENLEQGKIMENMMKNHVNGEHDNTKPNIEAALLKGKQHRL